MLVPSALGDPDASYLTTLPDGSQAASLLYADGPVLVQTFRARATPFIEKTIGSGAQLERLTVDGAPAYWIKGAHGFAYRPATSGAYDEQRLAGNTLLVDRADGILLRIEGRLSRDARGRDRALSSVTGPAASSPAARSDGPCGAAPPPTGRSGSAVKISSRVGGSTIHASSASSSSS